MYVPLVASSAVSVGDLAMAPRLAAAGGGTTGNPGATGAYTEGIGGVGAGDVGCWWHVAGCHQRRRGWCRPTAKL
jgi:hypothetical protein